MTSTDERGPAFRQIPRRSTVANVVIGSLATFGVTVSGAMLAVVVAGLLQWKLTVPDLLDDGLPLLMLGGGMLVAGRVAVDVAGAAALWCAVGAATLTASIGALISATTSAHGDGIEPLQVLYASLIVLVAIGGSAWLIQRRRRRRH